MRSLAGDTHGHLGPCDPTAGVRPKNENRYGSVHAVGLFTPKGEKAGESRRPSTAEWPIPARRSHAVGWNRAIKLADVNPSRTPRPLAPGFCVSEASGMGRSTETQSSRAAAGGGAESAGTCHRAAQHGEGIKCHRTVRLTVGLQWASLKFCVFYHNAGRAGIPAASGHGPTCFLFALLQGRSWDLP